MFIELHDSDGDPRLFNLYQITSVTSGSAGVCQVNTVDDAECEVKETYQQVVELIEQSATTFRHEPTTK